MDAILRRLLAVLDEETACYRNMQTVLIEEEAAMSLREKAPFDQIQKQKEALVNRIQEHEPRRKALVDALAAACQVDPATATVSRLAPLMQAPDDERLRSCAHRLRSAIAVVRLKNNHNRLLIGRYLQLVNGALKLLTRQSDDQAVYRHPEAAHPLAGYARGGGRLFCGSG
jgi:flagellar biosynthesis/type III secretory pathway chaperone